MDSTFTPAVVGQVREPDRGIADNTGDASRWSLLLIYAEYRFAGSRAAPSRMQGMGRG
jgi:hypothetical protein